MRFGRRTRYGAGLGAVVTLMVAAVANAASSSPIARFKTPGAPAAPVAYHGFLWVMDHRGGAIYKIDPKRNRVVHAYQTFEPGCWIAGSGNSIVFNPCEPGVTVLNIRTGRMRKFRSPPEFVMPHRRPGVAYWDGSFRYAGSEWTILPRDVTVTRSDPKTHVVLRRWRGIDDEGTATIADGSIWIPGLTTVARIDVKSDTLTIIQLPGAARDPGPNQGYAVETRAAVTPGTVWITNPVGLYRIDERTNAVTHVPGISVGDLDQLGNIDLVAARGSLFMRNGPNRVIRIDPTSGQITGRYPASGGGGGIEVGFGSLWVTNFISDTTWRDPLG